MMLLEAAVDDTHDRGPSSPDGVTLSHLSEQVKVLNRIVRDGNGAPPLMIQTTKTAEQLSHVVRRIDTLEDDVKRIDATITLDRTNDHRNAEIPGWVVTRDDIWSIISLLAGALLAWAQIYFTR
jgi:hypothetical protein